MVVGTVDGVGLSVQGAQVTITDNDPAPMVHPMLEECETTDVWCAKMTVGRVLLDAAGEVRADETNAGYDATMARGALRPDSFELGGVSYTVDRLYRAATSTEMTILLFVKTSPRLPDVDRAAPGVARGRSGVSALAERLRGRGGGPQRHRVGRKTGNERWPAGSSGRGCTASG